MENRSISGTENTTFGNANKTCAASGNDSNSCSGSVFPTTQSVFTPNYILSAAFWIIFIVGVFGNLLLLVVNVWRRSSKQAATQLFMLSLSVSDLGLLLGTTWVNAVLAVNPSFTFGRVMCKLTSLWSGLAADCSISVLSVIGIDRYLSMTRPGNCFFTSRGALLVLFLVWLAVLSTDIPLFIWFDLVQVGEQIYCTTVGVSQTSYANYAIASRLITFWFPLVVTSVSYFGIWWKMTLLKKKNVVPSDGTTRTSELQRSRKVAKMCTIVVALFTLSWLPFEINIIYLAYGSDKMKALSLFSPMFVFANINSCINPIIYGFMWKPMREALQQMFRQCRRTSNLDTSMQMSSAITKVQPAMTSQKQQDNIERVSRRHVDNETVVANERK